MNDEEGSVRRDAHNAPAKKTSMATLVAWNVSKALENNSQLDLRVAIRAAQERLDQASLDVDAMTSRSSEERHLACAVLAWQQLGHQHADSLYSFIASNRNEKNNNQQNPYPMKVKKSKSRFDPSADAPLRCQNNTKHSTANLWGLNKSASLECRPGVGPVLRIPVEPRVVMRLDSRAGCRHGKRTQPAPARDVSDDIDAACCLDTECVDKLRSMDKATAELRARAQQLAKREAERATLLERAEMAWRDLEAGYQRRLLLSEEKEHDIAKQTTKLIEERNGYKSVCTSLVAKLKQGSEVAEKEREQLTALEREVCARACERGQLAEQATRSDALLADHLCKAAQLDRDIMLKEEQGRRKQLALESEAEAAQALTHEAERAVRAELGGLKAHLDQVARDLTTADQETNLLTTELNDLREERNGLAEDLEGCQEICDGRMKAKMDELKKQREQLLNIKNQEMECRCKMPVDAAVEAKRTPSLAALCHCSPEQKLVDPCSCTSLRSRLLTDLLADLFGGLQTHLASPESQMPCQLLKCLEDKHNWDRATAVKSALRDFFSQLLLGELDIAIATSIENYHAKWVGASCADEARMSAPCGTKHSAGWQERALELKAQKMASKLAEQLFEKKAQELAQQAKNILAKTGRPPCECHPASCSPSPKAVYQCIVKPPPTRIPVMPTCNTPPKYLRQTLQDVNYLKTQIEDLKKDSIKREDLNVMEEKIAKMVQFASVSSPISSLQNTYVSTEISIKKDLNHCKPVQSRASGNNDKKPIIKRKQMQFNVNQKKANKAVSSAIPKTPAQQFSVNMCLYDAKKKSSAQHQLIQQLTKKPSVDQSPSRDIVSPISSVEQTNPIISTPPQISNDDCKASILPSCREDCTCFHKKPSNTSIDKLLETLTKWKDDLVDFPENYRTNRKQDNTTSLFKFRQKSSIVQEEEQCEIGDKKNIKNMSKIKSHYKKSLSHSENALKEPVVKNKDFTSVIIDMQPLVTESVYMGAINLEKSPDHSCRCVNNRNCTDTSKKNKTELPLKCIKSAKCVCKHDYPTPVHHEQGLDTQSFLFQKIISTESRTTSYDYNPANFPPSNKKINIEIGDVIKTCPSVKNVAQGSTSQRIEYDNHIKCLGVTLTTVTSKKLNKSKAKPIDNTFDDVILHPNRFIDSKKEVHQDKLNFKQRKKEMLHTQQPERDSYEECQENKKNQAYKRLNANHFNSEYESSLVSKDREGSGQTTEVQYLSALETLNNEACVCCHNTNADDSKDLEFNTFQLIEEHLKGKLEEFKNTFCKSSCIPNAEEEKLFTAILRRIKQLISESTCCVTCKCAGNSNKVTGSWNRAYNLLQEYLKTKIERVKCHCNSEGKIDDCNVLPNVLKNISHLIESDFQRIKAICKCKNANLFPINGRDFKNQSEINYFPNDLTHRKTKSILLEKDQVSTSVKQGPAESTWNVINVDSKNPILPASRISAEVLLMETKSCDAMKIDNKYVKVQTVQKGEITSMVGYKDTKNVCDCASHAEKVKSRLHPDFVIQSNEVRVSGSPFCETKTTACPTATTLIAGNKSDIHIEIERLFDEQALEDKNIISKKSRNASLPYIGYTMDCCCNSDLGCVCTKSTVRALNDRLKIRDIWKTFTNKKAVLQNVSYILDNTADKLLKDVNCVEVREDVNKKIASEAKSIHETKSNLCESTQPTIDGKGISLKKSKASVDKAHEMTNTVEHIMYTTDSSHEWCDVVLTPNVRKSERVSVLKPNKIEDLYFPKEIFMKNGSSNVALDEHTSRTSDLTCDCKMVPICHVKMLVTNIEDKLANAQCTCDSLTSKVCPVHS